MVQDLVFAIDGNDARLSRPVSLREVGPPTADSYTEWIVGNPELLGSGVRIIATDLRWNSDSGSDEVAIDVLGLGSDGRPVVGAVVIDGDPLGVVFAALTQAAYASRISSQTLAEMHSSYLRAHGQPIDEEGAMERLADHADGRLRSDLLTRPRMVIFAEQMSPAVLTTVTWLDQMGLDVTVHRLRAHDAGGQALLIVSRVFPSEASTEFAGVRARRFTANDRADREPARSRYRGSANADDERPPEHSSTLTNGFGHDH